MSTSPSDTHAAFDDTAMFARLLVGVCGSDRSLTALNYALQIARRTSGSVEGLIVQDLALSCKLLVSDADAIQQFLRQAERLADSAADRIERSIRKAADSAGVPVAVHRDQGRVPDCMVSFGDRASLMVLGKFGHRDNHGGLLGTNTELIVRRAHKPILLTPDSYTWPRRVLVAYGGKSLGPSVLRTGLACARHFSLPLTVFAAGCDNAHGRALLDKARSDCPDLPAGTKFDYSVETPARAIAQRARADTLLVMGAYGRSKLYRMILGSITTSVMRSASGPILLTAKTAHSAG